MLEQDAEKALERTKNRPMQHHRRALLAVLVDVVRAQPPGIFRSTCKRAALPVAADRIS
jgi:hypothetical protein